VWRTTYENREYDGWREGVMELIEAVKIAVEKALKYGASQAEAYATRSNRISIMTANDRVSGVKTRVGSGEGVEGISVRVVIGKSLAYSHTTILDEASIEETVKTAIKLAKIKEPDPDFKTLPQPRKPPTVEGIYDPAIENPPIDEIFDEARRIVGEGLEKDPNFNTISANFNFTSTERAIFNSLGVEVNWKESTASTGVTILGEKNGVRSVGWEGEAYRQLNKIDAKRCLAKAIERAKLGFKVAKIESGEKTVIFDPDALESLMEYAFVRAIDAYNVQEGKSYLTGKVGEKVASEKLTIIDDGTIPNGLRTAPTDAEGVPSQRNIIIENGVLKGYIYDSYTAHREGRESTGNAFRQFRTPISIAPRNMIITGKEVKLEELIGEVKEGVLVIGVMGAHSTNIATGAFSITANPSYAIIRGELAGQLRGCMIAGTFKEMLEKYAAQGDDVKQRGTLIAPSVKFEGIRITT